MKAAPTHHSKYGLSHSKRWMSCPASISLAELAPRPPEHPAALEGTLTHECLEALNKTKTSIAGMMTRLQKLGHPWERVQRAQAAYLRIQEIKKEYPGAEFCAETKVNTSSFTAPGNFGTVDAAIIEHFGILTVVDFKNGVMPVNPWDNTQLIGYALAFSELYNHNFIGVRNVILQPNCRTKSRTESEVRITMKSLRSWVPKFKRAVEACEAPNPKTNPGEWCFFCPAKNFNCPAFQNKANENALEDFEDL